MSDTRSAREKDIISNIRAIIISCKGGLRIDDVKSDYWEAFGERLPLSELGYTDLRDFFVHNPSEFYVFGNMVDVVMKASSAHIRSLVSRQRTRPRNSRKGVNMRHPKRRPSGPPSSLYSSAPPRFRRENSASTSKESRGHDDATEKMTLRKPKSSIIPEWAQPGSASNQAPKTEEKMTLRKPNSSIIPEWAQPGSASNQAPKTEEKMTLRKPKSSIIPEWAQPGSASNQAPKTEEKITVSENKKPPPAKTEPVTKTEKSGKSSRADPQKPPRPVADLGKDRKYGDSFENVEDPSAEGLSQSRLLKIKSKTPHELRLPKSDMTSNASKHSAEAKEMFFDVKSISSVPPNESKSASQIAMQGYYKNQKAQARIAQLQQTMQAMVQNMNLPSNEVNNNKKDKSGLKNEASNDKAIKQERPVEKPTSVRPKTVGSDSTPSSQKNEKPATDNSMYVQLLKELCNSRGFYDPTYKILVREELNEPKNYICKVQIEDYLQMSSYPIETQDPIAAKEIAAKKIYNYCVSDETFRKKDKKEETLISRVLNIVSSTYGVWSDKLPVLYINAYQEKLPEDWFHVISKSPLFEVENYDADRCIIRKKTERSVIDMETLQRFKGVEVTEKESEKSRDLPELELPKSIQWAVYVTNVVNSDEVWCRLIGEQFSDAYDSMMTKLELEPPVVKAEKPKIGGFYCIKVSAVWYRIRLTEWVNENEALAFYIDIGDKDLVKKANLYEPDENFFSVAPQAVTFSLFELGCFSDDDEITSHITENFLGKSYIGEIISDVGNSESTGRKIVRFWDTSTDHDVNVNQTCINNIIKSIRAPSLPHSFHIRDVMVTSVSDNGEIHVQTEQKSVYRLNCIILNKVKAMGEEIMRRKTPNTIGTDILYLTRHAEDGKYCRVKLTEILNASMVDVLFIDYGFVQRKSVSDLIHLEKTSILQAIPPQAIKVKLGNLMLPDENIVTKLRETVLNQTTLMKVISFNQGGLPSVEFFKRSSDDNLLYSINTEIKDRSKLMDVKTSTRRKSVVFGLERVLPKNLPGPDLPEIGQHFEVFVTLASSPDLFIVQPLSYREQFMKLMNELQKRFADGYAPMPTDQDIVVGELYAVLHPDGNWYRGCAQAVVGSYSYSIYMCDFGDCIMVTRDKIMPLPEPFRQFPYQAIRATLQGIPQEHRDWTPLDCVAFHKLVVEKYFVSTVIEINRDEKNPNYLKLGLILTDTSRDEDVYIHKILMEMKTEGCPFASL